MKKPFSIDYSIESDKDRVAAIYNILDSLDTPPKPEDLETMATYMLCGKDENGLNAVHRGEIVLGNTRYNSFRRTDDKNVSLEALLENPAADESELKQFNEKKYYIHGKPGIRRPKYDKKTGEMIDPGDSEVPGMVELWESIDRLEHWVAVLEGKVQPREDDLLFTDSYRLYKLKHQLIDLRRHQYYLKDSYNPPAYFPGADHPKPQFIDWTSDSFYWLTYEEWQRKIAAERLHLVSQKIEDYETKTLPDGALMVKWLVRKHTFDWENPQHIRALINNYDLLENLLHKKIDTYGKTLLLDFERYVKMADLPPTRQFILEQKLARIPNQQIAANLLQVHGRKYNENHLGQILIKEIPTKIATAATRNRLAIDTPPEEKKICFTCKQAFPRDRLFFAHNRDRKDGYSSNCKVCEKKLREAKKKRQLENEQRTKN